MGAVLQCPSPRKVVHNHAAEEVSKHLSDSVTLKLTKREKRILRRHWEPTVLAQEPALFLKVMLKTIDDAPRLLDMLASEERHPSVENIAEWPKLRRMSTGNCAFFTKQITVNELDELQVKRDSERLGSIHIQYALHGFKPKFLDIWQSNMMRMIEQVHFPKESDKTLFLKAFKTLSSFLCTLMIAEYEDSMKVIRYMEKEYSKVDSKAESL